MRRWTGALLALAVLCLAAAVACAWGSAVLMRTADDYYAALMAAAGTDPELGFAMTEDEYQYADGLWRTSQTLFDLIAPFVVGALASAGGVVAVFAVRRDRRRAQPTAQAEATAAS
ncbi:MAG: hypothetical protein ABI566_08485 [Pseudolysinimonas sp.]